MVSRVLPILLMSSSAQAKDANKGHGSRRPAQQVPLTESCGSTRLTQWTIDLKKSTITKLRNVSFKDYYCEPQTAPPGTTNSVAYFLDKSGKTIWSRPIQVPVLQAFDDGTKDRLNGGVERMKTVVLQLKIPWNEFTENVRGLMIITNDGRKLGPTSF